MVKAEAEEGTSRSRGDADTNLFAARPASGGIGKYAMGNPTGCLSEEEE
jgi:hypothetical protein